MNRIIKNKVTLEGDSDTVKKYNKKIKRRKYN